MVWVGTMRAEALTDPSSFEPTARTGSRRLPVIDAARAKRAAIVAAAVAITLASVAIPFAAGFWSVAALQALSGAAGTPRRGAGRRSDPVAAAKEQRARHRRRR